MKWARTRAWAVRAPSRRKSKRPWRSATTERSGGGRGRAEEVEVFEGAVDADDVGGEEGSEARAARDSSASKSGLFHRGSSAIDEEVAEEEEPPEEEGEEEEGEPSAERWRRNLGLPKAAAAASD
jgi:hypothetical protein